jgi:hypothetical protein
MIMHYVDLAVETNVEMISASCELIRASKEEKHWRSLVSLMRTKYSGLITNSANWVFNFLNFISFNFYFLYFKFFIIFIFIFIFYFYFKI